MERERILAILYDRLEKAVEKRKIASWKLTNALSAPHRQVDGALIQVCVARIFESSTGGNRGKCKPRMTSLYGPHSCDPKHES